MSRPTMGRRSLLKLGSALLAAPAVRAGAAPAPPEAQPVAPVVGVPLYTARFVPEGAACRLAFVADHHYWPAHKENWGGGAQITSASDARMRDLVDVLNAERPDLSIHAGDVISAAGSFFPPPEEYAQQLAFAARLLGDLNHPAIATVGNHETLDAHYASHAQLDAWRRYFGDPYRAYDHNGWRFVTLNPMLPNPSERFGKGDNFGNVYGLDDEQLTWLRARLSDAAQRGLMAVVCVHVPPNNWVNADAFEDVIASAGCVRAVLCGHWHRNYTFLMGGVPVLVRTSNVEIPFGFHMVHLYPDGRIVVVQRSQHFPFEAFLSNGFAQGKQGAEDARYVTVGGRSAMPLTGLTVTGDMPRATVVDGHLTLASRNGRATAVIDAAALGDARLTLTAVKARADAMGALAHAAPDGTGGVEATLTARYSPEGKVFLASGHGPSRTVLARSWFNIQDDVAYRLTLESRGGVLKAAWTNMATLEAAVAQPAGRHFGLFVDRGTMFVTDLTLERLT